MGDEAIVDTHSFSLEGRAIRKVRQSVSRAEKAGYTTELVEVGDLDDTTFAALQRLSETRRGGAAERGFSMAMDALRRDDEGDTQLLIARDGDGCVRGYLHFVPSFGRAAASLSLMRRDPEAPNGLTEFLIVKAIEQLRARGIDEVSLNFAAFARFIHSPQGPLERAAGRLARRADAVFQIERLYRFNAKFFPLGAALRHVRGPHRSPARRARLTLARRTDSKADPAPHATRTSSALTHRHRSSGARAVRHTLTSNP